MANDADDELKRVMGILEKNKDKSFVKRILSPNQYPSIPAPDGTPMTHMMAWGDIETENGRKYIVYPTILYNGEQLIQFDDQSAGDRARDSGQYIEFDNPDDAAWFSNRYKVYWGQ